MSKKSTEPKGDRDLEKLFSVLKLFLSGDYSVRMPTDQTGVLGEIAQTVNELISSRSKILDSFMKVFKEVGERGLIDSKISTDELPPAVANLVVALNQMLEKLNEPLNEMVEIISAVSRGELNRRVSTEINGKKKEGQFFAWTEMMNDMLDVLSTLTSEISQVAREVGMEGKLGGQANVPGVAGTWKDLTDNVNSMATNLTDQVRGIAQVVTAVANGDLSKKVTVDVKGEIADLAGTINNMTETLALFADQVTQVAREVGMDGKLGGQANVPGVAGTWKDLTDNVNSMATNLTDQVRAIADVSTAVTKGDLTRSVVVTAKGEVAELKDNVNEMIRNLRETTEKNSEQDWLKTNLAKFNSILQGQRDYVTVSKAVLSDLAPLVEAQYGAFYIMEESESIEACLKLLATYAYKESKDLDKEWKMGEGLVGQCAYEKRRIFITDVPGDYVEITSGLGRAKPLSILILPVIFEGKVKAVIELASFKEFSLTHQTFLDRLTESIGIVLNIIEADMRTDELLKQSQSLTSALQSQQEELRQANDELEDKARLLEEQKLEVELKNLEVEQAKTAVEEKATQLALTSKYKSEFLSNMSHELRTPLNSLLILAEHLAANPKSHLDAKEVEFAKLIHVSGNDLLSLINEILDLSKIESGVVSVENASVPFTTIQDQLENTFSHVAKNRRLDFEITFASELPSVIVTDEMRLLQVMKNLLSNAFKFTEKGKVSVRVDRVLSGWSAENESLNKAAEVLAFTVEDTGIGISAAKQRIIFEAFQQGDGTTARKYGGTGLGLSISRELARLLGGELALVRSTSKQGSVFALYLPLNGSKGGVLEAIPKEERRTHSTQNFDFDSGGTSSTHEASSAIHDSAIADDRDLIEGDRVLLIIEDDPTFAKIILDLAREKGFKGIVAMRGSQALELVRKYKPDAITLDIHIPDIDGWTILDILKRDSDLRHIPVDVITVEDYPLRALSQGAFKYLTKPVSHVQLAKAIEATRTFLDRPMKNLLLVAGDKVEDEQITEQLGNGDITVHHARSGKLGLIEMGKRSFDCVAVATKMTDMSVADFITAMRKNKSLEEIPVVVFSGASITDSERGEIEKLGTASVVRSADSLDRLLDQTALFLHRVVSHLPEEKRKLLQQLHQAANNLGGKKVLIVDDDVRNIFALTAALESKGVIVSSAENGVIAIDLLRKTPDIDLVLMDIMMPEMDGYETMREIRKLAKFKKLPIIALTAKAMVGDREKCLEAGASDYLSKPVNIEQLSSLMQVWLSK
ncbi:MAG TPA: response regulator [Candidatus Paceibacterota bacterium]|nr:response regulator [Candidatus Paceibacterota bacterium]